MDPVIIAAWSNEGVTVYIDGVRYFCKGFEPKKFNYLKALIKNKAWGKAKNVVKAWPSERQDLKR